MKKHFINWFATIIQTNKKMLTSWILQGDQGAGKGLFTSIIKLIFSDTYVSEPVADAVFDKFNARWAFNKLFVCFNEIEHGSKGNKNYGKLKSYITDDTIDIEDKNDKKFTTKNCFNTMFFSNKNAIQIENSDRRYNVCETGGDIKERVLKENICETMDIFTENMKSEVEAFVDVLNNLIIDKTKANTAIDNQYKKSIVLATETSLSKVVHAIKKHDIKAMRRLIIDNVDNVETMDVVLKNIESNFEKNIIFNSHSNWLLSNTFGEDINAGKAGKMISSALKTETDSMKIKGKTMRYKYIYFQKELKRRKKEEGK